MIVTNENWISEEMKNRLNSEMLATIHMRIFKSFLYINVILKYTKLQSFLLFYMSVKLIFYIKGWTQIECVWINDYKLWPNKTRYNIIILNDRIQQNILISKS